MKIGLTYNLKEGPAGPRPGPAIEDMSAEYDTRETIQALARVFRSAGHRVDFYGAGLKAFKKLVRRRPEFVFNIAEGERGRNREAEVPVFLEMLGIPYSGSDPLTLSMTLDKSMAKRLVLQAGLATPDFHVLRDVSDLPRIRPRFPLFVKPLWQGSSIGIRVASKVERRAELADRLRWLSRHYPGEPLLVEEYIPGREITVGVLGNVPPYLLGMMEIGFQDRRVAARRLAMPRLARPSGRGDFIYSFEVKADWERLCEYTVPPRIPKKTRDEIRDSALRIYEILGCRDVARLDFRLKENGKVYFLEANPLPGLSPSYGDLVIMSRKMRWTYRRLVLTILNHALARNGLLRSPHSAV